MKMIKKSPYCIYTGKYNVKTNFENKIKEPKPEKQHLIATNCLKAESSKTAMCNCVQCVFVYLLYHRTQNLNKRTLILYLLCGTNKN